MADKQKYVPICLPESMVEELKVWKMAFSMSYGKNVTYAEMIRGMLDSLQTTEPGVVSALESMVKLNPSLLDKLAGQV